MTGSCERFGTLDNARAAVRHLIVPVAPGCDEMLDLRGLREHVMDALLQHSIRVGYALVLTQMFEPGLDQEDLQVPQ